ncbi:MAG TPA: hypothetical protein PL045_12640, partial [Chitinophagaceae bacterium]|nr:hypothetical protein [Chitinophagaceae bacterium]
ALSYIDYKNRGKTDSAAYEYSLLSPQAVQYFSGINPAFKLYLDDVSTLINGYKTLGPDYVNMHLKDPDNFAAKPQVNDYTGFVAYYRNTTGLPVISDAWGISENDSALLQRSMQQLKKSNLAYAIYFSATDQLTFPLTTATGGLNDLGKIFVAQQADNFNNY